MRLKPRLANLRREVLSRPPEFGVLVAIFAFAAAIFTIHQSGRNQIRAGFQQLSRPSNLPLIFRKAAIIG